MFIYERSGQAVECIEWRFELYCNTLLNKIHYYWFNWTTSFVLAAIKLQFELYLHYSKERSIRDRHFFEFLFYY